MLSVMVAYPSFPSLNNLPWTPWVSCCWQFCQATSNASASSWYHGGLEIEPWKFLSPSCQMFHGNEAAHGTSVRKRRSFWFCFCVLIKQNSKYLLQYTMYLCTTHNGLCCFPVSIPLKGSNSDILISKWNCLEKSYRHWNLLSWGMFFIWNQTVTPLKILS